MTIKISKTLQDIMKKQTNTISVYIISKNYGPYSDKAIQSVLKQSYKNWELYLVNDNSDDSTKKIFQKYKGKKKITVINYKTTQGLQKISNHILKICQGNFIIRLDADDWLNENALSMMLERMLKSKKQGLIYSGYYYVDQYEKIIGTENYLENINNSNNLPPHGACCLISIRALKEVGGYGNKFKAQDGWDIWLKLKNRVSFEYVNLPLFYYRRHEKSLTNNNKKIIEERSKIFAHSAKKYQGDYKLKILAVIPVKKDIKKIKDVPFKKYKNQYLIDYAINTASSSKEVTDILISTSSKKVIDFVKEKKIKKKIYINKRSKKYDTSINKIEDILVDSSNYYKKKSGYYPDILVFINIHNISHDPKHIKKAIDVLIVNQKNTIFSAYKENNPTFSFLKGKVKLLNKGRFNSLDFNKEIIYKFNNSIIVTWDNVIRNKLMFDENIGILESAHNSVTNII